MKEEYDLWIVNGGTKMHENGADSFLSKRAIKNDKLMAEPCKVEILDVYNVPCYTELNLR